MIEFLQSLRSDLSSRRLLPFVALAAVALIAAVAYAVTGGSGSSTPKPVASLPSISVTGSASALPVTVAPTNPNEAVSETPGGVRYQSEGATRDPFIPLPSPPATKTAASVQLELLQQLHRLELRWVVLRQRRVHEQRLWWRPGSTRPGPEENEQAEVPLRRLRLVRARLDHTRAARDARALRGHQAGRPAAFQAKSAHIL